MIRWRGQANSGTAASGTSGTSFTYPAGTIAGDVAIYLIEVDGGPAVSPPGALAVPWTQLYSVVDGGGAREAGWIRPVQAGETTSGAFTWAGAQFHEEQLHVYEGVDNADMLAGTPATSSGAASATHVMPTMTSDVDRAMLIRVDQHVDVGGSHTWPTGWNKRADQTSISLADAPQGTQGATGTLNVTSPNTAYVGITFALKPATPTAQTDTVLTWASAETGATAASPAAAWTAGAWVDVLPIGWDFDIALGDIEFEGPAAPTLATTFEVLFEVGTGAAGSETVIAQIPWTFRNVTAIGYLRGDPINLIGLPEPITVPAGTRVAVRVRDSHTAALTYTGVKAMFRELAAAAGGASTASAVTGAGTTAASIRKATTSVSAATGGGRNVTVTGKQVQRTTTAGGGGTPSSAPRKGALAATTVRAGGVLASAIRRGALALSTARGGGTTTATATKAAACPSTARGGGNVVTTKAATIAAAVVSLVRGGGQLATTVRKAISAPTAARGGGTTASADRKGAASSSTLAGGGRAATATRKLASTASALAAGGRVSSTVTSLIAKAVSSAVTGGGRTAGAMRKAAAPTSALTGAGAASTLTVHTARAVSRVAAGGLVDAVARKAVQALSRVTGAGSIASVPVAGGKSPENPVEAQSPSSTTAEILTTQGAGTELRAVVFAAGVDGSPKLAAGAEVAAVSPGRLEVS